MATTALSHTLGRISACWPPGQQVVGASIPPTYRRRGVAIARCAIRSRKLRARASAGRYCGRIIPIGRETPEVLTTRRRDLGEAAAGIAGIVGLSKPVRAVTPTAAMVVVTMTVIAVMARVATVIMLMIRVSFRVEIAGVTAVPAITLIGSRRRAAVPTRLISVRPTPRGLCRPTRYRAHCPSQWMSDAASPPDTKFALPLRYRDPNLPPSSELFRVPR